MTTPPITPSRAQRQTDEHALIAGKRRRRFRDALTGYLFVLPALPGEILLISNEVGLGIVPLGSLARLFRDEAGRLNQDLAAACERATFVAAGLPLALKTP
jgi:adenosylcobinamide kinase/adenosylcobinamide-phosphate guanylyltransferase